MEIRIPNDSREAFNDLNLDVDLPSDSNIQPVVRKVHLMRNEQMSIQVTLTPAYQSKLCQTFRRRDVKDGICFHGYLAYLDLLFQRVPKAQVRSLMTDKIGGEWMNATNFKRMAHEIESLNVGSPFEPLLLKDACSCVRKVRVE